MKFYLLNFKELIKKEHFFRYKKDILRYGFWQDNLRVVVANKALEKVRRAIPVTNLHVSVIPDDEFDEKILHFCGQGKAQGKKLYTSTDVSEPQASPGTEDKEEYGTLGCLANLNNQTTVALTSMHLGCKTVYIENGKKMRIPLGTLINKLPENSVILIQNDLAIIAVDSHVQDFLCEKKLLNATETPTNAFICFKETTDLYKEIVHKFGASSKCTTGRIVQAEVVSENLGIFAVEGMNGEEFGEPGDSGAIVFREVFDDQIEGHLEVVAILSGTIEQNEEKESTYNKSAQSSSSIVCTSFHKALVHFQTQLNLETPIKSIDFFND